MPYQLLRFYCSRRCVGKLLDIFTLFIEHSIFRFYFLGTCLAKQGIIVLFALLFSLTHIWLQIMDHAFPYLIQFVKEYQGKVDKLVAAAEPKKKADEGTSFHAAPDTR